VRDKSRVGRCQQTKSELLFERFCRERDIELKRIPPVRGRRSPDYEFCPCGERVVVEVAQLDPNDDDHQYGRKRDDGSFVGIGGSIGQRIRQKSTDKADQRKAWSKGALPAILVVYNNTGVRSYTSPEHICAAMFGFVTYVIDVPTDPSKPNLVVDRKRGRGSRMTAVQNTSISAIAVLEEDTGRGLKLLVYHNKKEYATNPVDPGVLGVPGVEQYCLEERILGQAQGWIRCDGDAQSNPCSRGRQGLQADCDLHAG
jgi:hypothetical protein